MSFCCAVKPLNQALAVRFEILGRNHSPGFIRPYIALSIGAFTVVVKTSCLFTLPNPPTCTVLHFLWAKICQWVTNYFLPSNDSAMVLIFAFIFIIYIILKKILCFRGGKLCETIMEVIRNPGSP
jgi:hypothetical protein